MSAPRKTKHVTKFVACSKCGFRATVRRLNVASKKNCSAVYLVTSEATQPEHVRKDSRTLPTFNVVGLLPDCVGSHEILNEARILICHPPTATGGITVSQYARMPCERRFAFASKLCRKLRPSTQRLRKRRMQNPYKREL